ncbi:hypothetical protein [Thiosocius teredinicola]|uniref:hypothetical protein n=1 Tax=Thiosocius teredinicola TaxID=1973002 RepID=UPI000F794910
MTTALAIKQERTEPDRGRHDEAADRSLIRSLDASKALRLLLDEAGVRAYHVQPNSKGTAWDIVSVDRVPGGGWRSLNSSVTARNLIHAAQHATARRTLLVRLANELSLRQA